jgi:hypothetical protein
MAAVVGKCCGSTEEVTLLQLALFLPLVRLHIVNWHGYCAIPSAKVVHLIVFEQHNRVFTNRRFPTLPVSIKDAFVELKC